MFKPLGDYILIEITKKEKTASGIILLDDRLPPQEGIIRETNKKCLIAEKHDCRFLHIGDKVLFSKYGPIEYKEGEKRYFFAKQEDLLAKIEEDA